MNFTLEDLRRVFDNWTDYHHTQSSTQSIRLLGLLVVFPQCCDSILPIDLMIDGYTFGSSFTQRGPHNLEVWMHLGCPNSTIIYTS